MAHYEEARVKLTNTQLSNTQLSKLKSAANHDIGTTLRATKKNFQYEEFLHELFLTTKQQLK